MGKGAGVPGLSEEQAERVVDAMALLLRERCAGVGARLAALLEVSPSTVSKVFDRKQRPSLPTAERVAALVGVGTWELLGASSGPPASATHERLLEARPNLAAALRVLGAAAEPGRASVVAAAAALPDLVQPTWIAMLLDPGHHREAGSPPASSAPITRRAHEEDSGVRRSRSA